MVCITSDLQICEQFSFMIMQQTFSVTDVFTFGVEIYLSVICRSLCCIYRLLLLGCNDSCIVKLCAGNDNFHFLAYPLMVSKWLYINLSKSVSTIYQSWDKVMSCLDPCCFHNSYSQWLLVMLWISDYDKCICWIGGCKGMILHRPVSNYSVCGVSI